MALLLSSCQFTMLYEDSTFVVKILKLTCDSYLISNFLFSFKKRMSWPRIYKVQTPMRWTARMHEQGQQQTEMSEWDSEFCFSMNQGTHKSSQRGTDTVSEMTQNKSVRSQGHSDACIDPSNSCRHGENSTPSTVSCFSISNHPHQQQMHHALLAIAS